MVKSTFARVVLCLAVLAFSLTALAASKDVVLSKDGKKTVFTGAPSKASKPYAEPDAASVIYGNLATKYPDGVYWCCEGATITGPDNFLDSNLFPGYFEAAGFTPSASANVTKIKVAVGWVNYGETYTDVILSLNNDSAGVPGTVIKKWKVQIGSVAFGSCCTVESKSGTIPVTAGTPYWVVLSTEKKSDVWAAWNIDDTLQLSGDAIPTAFYCTNAAGSCGSNNNTWYSYQGYPGFAFEVDGK